MVTYKFKLIDSKVPVLKGKKIMIDSNVGGTKNTYKIYQMYWLKLAWLGFTFMWPIYNKYICKRTFWRPYQKEWDKRGHRVPPAYWGKGPLLNLWLVLSNDYEDPSKEVLLITESNTLSKYTEICGIEFLSQELNKNLKSNNTFYQSKIEKYEK
jgi:hypothetical protein